MRTLSQNGEQALQKLRTNRIVNKRAFLKSSQGIYLMAADLRGGGACWGPRKVSQLRPWFGISSPCAPAEARRRFFFYFSQGNLDNWVGNLEGIFRGFFLTHRTKAQKFRGKFRSIFHKKIRGSKRKIFRAKFTLQTCHLKDFLAFFPSCWSSLLCFFCQELVGGGGVSNGGLPDLDLSFLFAHFLSFLGPFWDVAKGSSVSWVAKFKGAKNPEWKLSKGWSVTKLQGDKPASFCWEMSGREVTGWQISIPIFHGTLWPMDFWTPPRFVSVRFLRFVRGLSGDFPDWSFSSFSAY